MHSGDFLFYRVTIKRFAVDMRKVKRQAGLEMMLGSHILANVMGPDEDLAVPIGDPATGIICQSCAFVSHVLPYIHERIIPEEKEDELRTQSTKEEQEDGTTK